MTTIGKHSEIAWTDSSNSAAIDDFGCAGYAMRMKKTITLLFFALFRASLTLADCPSAAAYLGGSFSQAKQLMAKTYGNRTYTNGPVCTDRDYELTPSDSSDLAGCTAGNRQLTAFSVIGFPNPDLILNARYIFSGAPLTKTDVEALLNVPLVPATRVPAPLDQLISKAEKVELYQTRDRRYLVRITSSGPGSTVMVIRVATIKPAEKLILACVDAQRP